MSSCGGGMNHEAAHRGISEWLRALRDSFELSRRRRFPTDR